MALQKTIPTPLLIDAVYHRVHQIHTVKGQSVHEIVFTGHPSQQQASGGGSPIMATTLRVPVTAELQAAYNAYLTVAYGLAKTVETSPGVIPFEGAIDV